jgi:hypothetical protein
MRQQPQVVMHINQAFSPVCIQVVSLYIVDEAIVAPTPLCIRGVNSLTKHLHRQFMQIFGRGAIHVPPFDRTHPVLIFGCMQVTKDSMLTDVFTQFASYLSTLLFIRYQLVQCKRLSILHLWMCVVFSFPHPQVLVGPTKMKNNILG